MKKRLKKRVIGKKNKNAITRILNNLNIFNIRKKVFGNGYFIFDFEENSICWFWLEEFPDWKFGLWLNKDGSYDVFGEAICLIDKFKPSASTLSMSDIFEFEKELVFIQEKEPDWLEYLKEIEEQKKEDLIEAELNKDRYASVLKVVNEFNDKYMPRAKLEIKDRNSKHFRSSPRYDVTYLCVSMEKEEESEIAFDGFEMLCRGIAFDERSKDFFLDDFTYYYFNGKYIYNEKEFGENAFGWKEDTTLEDYLKETMD